MKAHFGERGCEFDQASAILDSNSEEASRETKMLPREWELEPTLLKPIWRRIYDRKLQNENACTAGYIAKGGYLS